jgi:hypothetical protein
MKLVKNLTMPIGPYRITKKLRPFFFNLVNFFCLSAFILSGALFSNGCDRKQDSPGKSGVPPPTEAVRQSDSPAKSQAIPDCPPAEGPDVLALPEKTEHIVILKWRASASDPKHPDPVGYCLYRSLQGKRQPLQRVNLHPLPQTACTDDLVENNKKYDYRVMAISKKQIMSRPSNVARAEIPKDKPRKHTEEAPPLCRATDAPK